MDRESPVRIAVIGAGLIGQGVHIPTLRRMDEFELVAVADPSAKVCRELGARYPEIRMHTDWRELLETHRLDAFAICSPNATHAEITLAALDAGLHALVEKPLAITVEDIDEITQRAAARELVVQVGYMKRFDAAYERLVDSLSSDAGDLRFIDVVTFDPWMARPPFAPSDLVSADDIPAAERKALAEQELAQVEVAIGTLDIRAATIYSNVYLGALIHDVNLVHGVAERLGMKLPGRAVTSSYWAEGKAAQAVFELDAGVQWSSTWLLLDGLERFTETATFYFEECIESLRFDAPYYRESPTVLESIRGVWAGADERVEYREVKDSYKSELQHFHACLTKQTPCRTPPALARTDQLALQDAFRTATGTAR